MEAVEPAIDITAEERETILELLERHLSGTAAWIYGSRAKWTSSLKSDLDLVVFATHEQKPQVGDLREAFEESDLPFRVDLFVWDDIPQSFREQIAKEHVVLAKRRTGPQSSWPRVPLGDVIDLLLSSVDKKTKSTEFAVRLCNYTDVYKNTFIHSGLQFMSATATEREIAKCALVEGDVVITKDSEEYDDIGVPALVRETMPDLVCGYHLAILRARASRLDGAYLFYALSAAEAQQQFHSYANGVTRFGLRKADIQLVDIPLPPLPVQRTIAHVLGTLDDKIELNRRMNETLEAISRALFKSWFVDFEPVHAKMEGRGAGLPKERADLFPDRMIESELGEIPKSWTVERLGDILDVVGGTTPSTKVPEYWKGGSHKWATPKDLSTLSSPVLLDTGRKITDAGLAKIGSGLLPRGTVLLSSRAPIGYLAIAENPVAINQGFIAMLPTDAVSNLFMLYWCRIFHEEIIHHANGSTFLEISKRNFRRIPICIPERAIMSAFDRQVRPYYSRIVSNEREIRALAAQRDALLPGLISGELRVKSIDHGIA